MDLWNVGKLPAFSCLSDLYQKSPPAMLSSLEIGVSMSEKLSIFALEWLFINGTSVTSMAELFHL